MLTAKPVYVPGDDVRFSSKLGRPDWAAAWIATARTNLLRKIAAAGELGFWPIAIQTDALIYAGDEPDPTAALPAPLKLDPLALGAFKHIGRIDSTAALPLIGTPDLWEALKGRPPAAERPAAAPGGEGTADAELVAYGPDYSDADYWDDE